MADNVSITAGSGTSVSTEEVTTLNAASVAAQHVQRVLLANRTADGTAVDVDPATQTTLAAALVQLTAIAASVDGLEGYNDGVETKLDTLHTDLGTIDGHVDGLEGAFTTLNAKDFATQTTLAAVLAKIIAAPATEAKQDTLLTAVGLLAKLTDTQPVSAASLPLPSGAATSAKQDTGNTSVASIDTKTPALSSGRVPVDASGVAVPITDNSGSITVDGTFWQATQPVSGPLTDTQLRATSVTVDSSAGVPTAITDTGTVGSITKYLGITVANTSTSATAAVRIRNNTVAGTIIDTIHLAANESISYTYPRGRSVASGTLYMQVVSGAVEGSVFTV